MLPLEESRDYSFQEILEKAKEKINNIYPVWTNYNPADSGMALLELFAYMTELQQFHVEQIGQSHLLAFLHLLGMCPRGLQPARVYAKGKGIENAFFLPKGIKVLAGEVVFEAEQTVYMEQDNILIGEENTVFYPFGQNPQSGASYEIHLQRSLEEGIFHTLYFQLYDEYPVKRNPIDAKEFIPLVRLQLEYYDGAGYQACEILKDTTFGLLQSGLFQFRFHGRMGKYKEEYKLRLTVTGEYDTAPLLMGIHFNMIPFVQKDTILECQRFEILPGEEDFYEIVTDSWYTLYGNTRIYIKTERGYKRTKKFAVYDYGGKRHFVFATEVFKELSGKVVIRLVSNSLEQPLDSFTYIGSGMPDQQFFLPDRNVLGAEFAIWIEEEKNPGYYTPWFRVLDFAQAGHMDRCYVLEEERGILRFGNGKQGVIPKGKIEVISYVLCAGSYGNIQKKQMTKFYQETGATVLYNPLPATGGKNKESINDCFKRYAEEIKIKNRAVTYGDYEEIVRKTPGLRIRKVKVFSSTTMENCLEVVVQPFTDEHRILQSDAYDKNILRLLGKKKMLGTHIVIRKPEYISINVSLEVLVKNHYPDVKTRIEEQIKRYFDEYMDFGKAIIYSRIFGYIDALSETAGIRELTIQAMGRGVLRDENKDIYLPFYGMACLEEVRIRCILTDES